MKTKLTFAIIVCIALMSCACISNRRGVVPSKEMTTFEIPVDNITAISAASSIYVIYSQAEKTSVEVECPDNVAELLDITVRNGELSAKFKHGTNFNGDCYVTVTVCSPVLRKIDASSSSVVSLQEGLTQSGGLEIEVSSSASVEVFGVTANRLEVEASSSGKALVQKAAVNDIDLDASSSANVVLSVWKCENIDAEASSSASIHIEGTGAKNAVFEASSAASIDAGYFVVAQLKSAKASSAASIECCAETVGKIVEESAGSVDVTAPK